MPKTAILFVAVALPALHACAEPQNRVHLHPTFGDAVRQNIAAHVINPTPGDVSLPPIHSGSRIAIATERYRTDQSKVIVPVVTGGGQ